MRSSLVSITGVLAAVLVVAVGAASPAVARDARPAGWESGINLTDWSPTGYAQARSALEAARAAGVTSVSLVPTLYVRTATDSGVGPDPHRTPTDASLRQAAADAHALGLQVTIKPHVDVLDGTFRGELAPADPSAWFAAYDTWVTHYAQLAQAVGADTFVVGTELDSLVGDQTQWSHTIDLARAAFSGRLTYAANWNAVSDVGFWSRLDAIGVDAYVPVGDASSTVSDIETAWEPFAHELGLLHAQTGKPVLFTELGYQPRSDALTTPFSAHGAADPAVQARGYQAALAFWSKVPWMRGISWWDWPAQPGMTSGDDGGFSPRGLPAEAVLRRFNGAPAAASAVAQAPGGGSAALPVLVLIAGVGLVGACVVKRRAVRRVCERIADRAGTPRPPEPAGLAAAAEPEPEPASASDVDAAILRAMSVACATLDSDTAVLFVRDEADPRLARVVQGIGVGPGLVGRVLSSDEGLMGHVLMTGNAIAVANYDALPTPIQHPFGTRAAALSVPIHDGDRLIGALTVGRPEQYAPSERHLLRPLANEIAALLTAARHPAALLTS